MKASLAYDKREGTSRFVIFSNTYTGWLHDFRTIAHDTTHDTHMSHTTRHDTHDTTRHTTQHTTHMTHTTHDTREWSGD
jgi:hypothetical protein